MSDPLRIKTIRLAATMPKGSAERRALLQALHPQSRIAVRTEKLDPHRVYYHGTPSESTGKAILRSGIKPPDITTRGGAYRPVEGRVYLTPHIAYAMLYALGGGIAEKFMWLKQNPQYLEKPDFLLPEFPQHTWGGSAWGYLFIVPWKAITEVHPDEDSIGEMITNRTGPDWLSQLAKRILTPIHPETQPNKPDTFYDPNLDYTETTYLRQNNLYDLVGTDNYFQLQAQAVAGKILLDTMTPQQELDLVLSGAHVAHEGAVIPSECWRIHKGKAHLIKPDGSNFFQLADRCG